MNWVIQQLQAYPELALFFTLAAGYAIGKIQIKGFRIGSVTGVLLAGVVVGQFGITIDNTVKSVFFLMFLFALGYNVGPGFFKALRKDGIPQVIFTVIVCVSGLASVVIAGKLLGYNAGQAAGLTAGALTQSAVIGVGQGAIASLKASADEIKTMSDFVPIGYAVTYIFGTVGSALFLSAVGPRLLGINLVDECKKIEPGNQKVIEGDGIRSGFTIVAYRCFQLAEEWVGKTVQYVETAIGGSTARVFIVRIRRGENLINAVPEMQLEAGDHIVFSFRKNVVGELNLDRLGNEVADFELMDFPVKKMDVYVKSDKLNQKTIQEIKDHVLTRGVFLSNIREHGADVEERQEIKIRNRDILTLEGPQEAVENVAKAMGKLVKRSSETDVVFLGFGILFGGIIGIPALTIAGMHLSLSTSGGALIMGLIFGYYHDRKPSMGQIPKSAIWFMNNVGLAAFIAVVGINAGPGFVSGLKTSGVSFFLAGVVVTLIPLLVGILVGKYIFKWNGALILGACAGAMTTTAALGAVCEKSRSNIPVLSYTVTYAVGNILLTIWGSIVVLFFS